MEARRARATIGQSMRACRRRCGYNSALELAEASGVCCSTILHAEQDKTFPTALTLVLLADVLGVSLDEYIGREVPGGRK